MTKQDLLRAYGATQLFVNNQTAEGYLAMLNALPVADNPIEIDEWIATGDFTGNELDSVDIIDTAAQILDSQNTAEHLATNLFLGTDDQYYTTTVEAILTKANPKWVKDVLSEELEEAKTEGDEEKVNRFQALLDKITTNDTSNSG